MTDPRAADFAALAEGEALSAYLSGDLEPAAAAALEARLASDPALAARLEQMRELLESLRGLDDVPVPDGYAERLQARLAQARGQAGSEEPATATPAIAEAVRDPAVRSISSAPSRRRAPWAAIGAVAAALLAVVAVPQVLMRSGVTGDAGIEAADAPAAGEPEMQLFDDAPAEPDEAPADEAESAEALAGADTAAPRQAAPVLRSRGSALADDDALRAHFSELPEASALLGTPLGEAQDLASAHQAFVYQADELSPGVHPGACLDPLVADAAGPVVVAVVEALEYQDAPALAYVLVSASGGAEQLDRVELWVVEPDTCRARTFLDLSP